MVFSNLSIKIKLMVTLGIVSVMLVAVGLLGINDLQRSNRSLQDIFANKLVPGNALAMAFQLTGEQRAAALRAANAGKADAADAVVSSAKSQQDQLNGLLKTFRGASMSGAEQIVVVTVRSDAHVTGQEIGARHRRLHSG